MKLRTSLLTLALVIPAAACSTIGTTPASVAGAPMAAAPQPAARGPFTSLTVPQYRTISETSDFFSVNVHIPFDGDLPGTDVSIAFDQILTQLDKLPQEKTSRILLYCRSGPMSVTAAQALASVGYTNLFILEGGMNAWRAAGHAMATAD